MTTMVRFVATVRHQVLLCWLKSACRRVDAHLHSGRIVDDVINYPNQPRARLEGHAT